MCCIAALRDAVLSVGKGRKGRSCRPASVHHCRNNEPKMGMERRADSVQRRYWLSGTQSTSQVPLPSRPNFLGRSCIEVSESRASAPVMYTGNQKQAKEVLRLPTASHK